MKVVQSCPALCNPMDYTVHGILQARILEWVAFPFSRGSSQPRDRTQVSRIAGGLYQLSQQGSPGGLPGWTPKPFQRSILKEINPKYSLEELMLKLKLQYTGHLM
ncbi:unnamed protein product [Rangifer tarandus platyrhynchus]|uniref:Uncharacterized protein n=1 Tax=Rangifer tarandus platyrhynchus TaxID=3082113 RepID=A0ABN8YC67_RANTA|nr:unnamed protein product [Rangifer tarandus platyrhynchus]